MSVFTQEANSSGRFSALELFQKLTIAASANEAACLLDRVSAPEKPTILAFLNQHAVSVANSDSVFARRLLSADFLLRDGVGVKAALWSNGIKAGVNLNGTDLIPQIIARFRHRQIAFFGTSSPWTEKAARLAQLQYSTRSISALNGFEQPEVYLDWARAVRPELIVLGMGMPRQEHVAEVLRSQLQHPCLIICGGAILDFLAQRFPRAPLLVRRAGMEWLFRLVCEPRRLWRRYTVGGALFLATALATRA